MNLRLSLITLLAAVILVSGCRRRSRVEATPPSGGELAAASPAETTPGMTHAVAAPPTTLPPSGEITPAVESRFRPNDYKQPYAPAAPGDYQTQLDLYNRVLRNWVNASGNIPNTMDEITKSYGTPKPPQPPPNRRLVYDPKTITVRLQ